MWRATASGGKSGTAEQLDWKGAYKYRPDGDYRKAISFAAILPADDPEILVLVMMDDPRWIFDYASQIVAPATGNIISQIAPYLGIERDASYDSNGSVEVPNAIGTRWTSAQVKMNAAGLSHRFVDTSDGDVVYQYPAGGTVVPAGSTVYLYTSPPPTPPPPCRMPPAKPEPLPHRCSRLPASMWQFRAVHRTVLSARILRLGVWCPTAQSLP